MFDYHSQIKGKTERETNQVLLRNILSSYTLKHGHLPNTSPHPRLFIEGSISFCLDLLVCIFNVPNQNSF